MRFQKNQTDSRPESYRPNVNSIRVGEILDTDDGWRARRDWIDWTLQPGMCSIQRRQEEAKFSLGAFRPRRVRDLTITKISEKWSAEKQLIVDQMLLFDDNNRPRLEKIPYEFRYEFDCYEDGCKGHSQIIIDWEIMELYRRVKSTDEATMMRKIRDKFLGELCGIDKDVAFFAGNHSYHRNAFMILGVFWPPKDSQQRLF